MYTRTTTPLRRIMAIPTNVTAPETGHGHGYSDLHPARTIAGSITSQASADKCDDMGEIITSGGAA